MITDNINYQIERVDDCIIFTFTSGEKILEFYGDYTEGSDSGEIHLIYRTGGDILDDMGGVV